MTPPRVLLLEAAGPESTALAASAIAAGCRVHAVTDRATHARYPPDLLALLDGCLLTDFTRQEQALDEIVGYARRIGAAAALTVNEYLTELLAHACATLGLPGNDPGRASVARDKVAMVRAFAAGGMTAPTTEVVDGERALRRILGGGSVGFPCVVKPATGAGSAGVTVVGSPSDLAEAWRAARAGHGMYGLPLDRRVLVQEHVAGAEYSVESVTHDGRTVHLCATAKAVTAGAHRVEIGHRLPAELPPLVEQAVHWQVERAIAAAGVRNGASHTEVVVDPAGRCTVVEIAARLGAGHIGFLLHHALGIDPWTALVDVALGRSADLTPTRRRSAAIRFLTAPKAGHLVAVHGLPRPEPGIPAVHLRRSAGELVEPPRDNRCRLGHFVVTGPDAAAVDRRVAELLSGITVEVEPVPAAPHRRAVRGEAVVPVGQPAKEFDELFHGEQRSGSFARAARLADPTLPPEVEPFSFLSSDLLHHVAGALALRAGDVLADLGCGRGGPGLWLARATGASLVGADFSTVAVNQARQRSAALGRGRGVFVTADLAATPFARASVTAAVAIDALQYATDRLAAAAEARRVLRPGGRLVVTGWHPHIPGDPRVPERHGHTDWPALLRAAGFSTVRCDAQPEWTDTWVAIYRAALEAGDPAGDAALAGLQSEARRRLPSAHLLRRVVVTAVAAA